MPKVTRAHFDARRRQILDAAFRCFAARGFHATTMQDVAEKAGLSAGALYRYFKGKEALAEALAAEGREQKRGALARLDEEKGAAGLARAVAEMLAFLETPGSRRAAGLDVRLWGEALGQRAIRAIVADGLEALKAPIADFVRRERRAGRIRRDVEPAAVGRVVLAVLAGLELQKAYHPDLDVRAAVDVVTTLLEGLSADGVRT